MLSHNISAYPFSDYKVVDLAKLSVIQCASSEVLFNLAKSLSNEENVVKLFKTYYKWPQWPLFVAEGSNSVERIFVHKKFKRRILAIFGFNREALRATPPKLHSMFASFF